VQTEKYYSWREF